MAGIPGNMLFEFYHNENTLQTFTLTNSCELGIKSDREELKNSD